MQNFEPSIEIRTDVSSELRQILKLAAPISLTFFGNMLIGIVNTAVAGRIGTNEIAAVGLGNSLFFAVTVIGLGLMLGLDPMIAQAVGADEKVKARSYFWQGIWISIFSGVLLMLVLFMLIPLLPMLGIDKTTSGEAGNYMYARMISVIPFLIFIGSRSYLQAKHITLPLIISIIAANIVNLPACVIFGFGNSYLGIPKLGTAGLGMAAALSVFVEVAVLLFYIGRVKLSDGKIIRRPNKKIIKKVFKIGSPISLQLLAEVGMFCIVAVLAGNISVSALAGHQIALTLAATTFMIPLGISSAASVLVGKSIGMNRSHIAKKFGVTSILTGAAFMSLMAVLFFIIPSELADIFTDKQDAILSAVPLIFIAAIFQIFDGTQCVSLGALRGAGDTRWPMFATIFSYYFVSLPVAVLLAFTMHLGVKGLWWGLCAGLITLATLLVIRFLKISSRVIERV